MNDSAIKDSARFHHRAIKKLNAESVLLNLARLGYGVYLRISNWRNYSPIIVYQMGKVGSRTVVETLRSLKLNRPIYHVHRLTCEGRNIVRQNALLRNRAYPGKPYLTGEYLINEIDSGPADRTWHVITLTRDPIARNLSAFFHAIEIWYPELKANHFRYGEEHFEIIKNSFLEKYPHDIPATWFDLELNQVFDFDIYESEFPKSVGYKIYKSGNVNLLVIRLENLQNQLKLALEQFLEIKTDNLDLTNVNLASSREYYSLYRKFIEWVVFPSDFLDRIYDSRFALHFYSSEEILSFKRKWGDLD
jgi:hypothetical protein